MIQTTNIRRIVDRIKRHPMMRDLPFESAVEYAVDFISLLGVPALYDEKTAIIEIQDWRGKLPCDFEQMIQVRMVPKGTTKFMPEYKYSAASFALSSIGREVGIFEFTYKIQGQIIFTSTKDDPIEIAYRAFAIDDEGYPLLPDNASFLRGLENYIKLQWFTVLFDMGSIPEAVLQNVQQEYAWAVGDAQSEFSRLSLDQAETLFNSFKSLLPQIDGHKTGFKALGSKSI